MNHSEMNVSQHCFSSPPFWTKRDHSLLYHHAREPQLLADVDTVNCHGLGTTQSASSQVSTWTTPHTNRSHNTIRHRPCASKHTFFLTSTIPSSLPSPPYCLTPDALVFVDRCLRIPAGSGFAGKSSRWRSSKSPSLPRESFDPVCQGTLPSPSFPYPAVPTPNA